MTVEDKQIMTSPIPRTGLTNDSYAELKAAKKLRTLNLLKISLAVIGALTVVIGIGFGVAFNPLLFTLIGVGALILALSLGLTYLAHKTKTRTLRYPEDLTIPETTADPGIKTFSKEETEAYFKKNFLLYTPPQSLKEDLYDLVNVQIEQPGHSARRSYKVAGSNILLHCLQGDPTLVSMRSFILSPNILWGYLQRDMTPVNQQLNEILSNSVTPESWSSSQPLTQEGELPEEGSTGSGKWISSSDHIKKAGDQNGVIGVSRNWENLGQLILPNPKDYEGKPEDAFYSAKQAFQQAITYSESIYCNIITLPLPNYDKQEDTSEWNSMIQRALLEAVKETGPRLAGKGINRHVVIIHPDRNPFSYPS